MKQILYFLTGFFISFVVGLQFVHASDCFDVDSYNSEFCDYYSTYKLASTYLGHFLNVNDCAASVYAAGSGGLVSTRSINGVNYWYREVGPYFSNDEYCYDVWYASYSSLSVCDNDRDDDGIPDDCDVYPDDPTDYQVGLSSYQTNSAGELVRQCFITDRGDVVCFGAAYNNSLVDNLIFNPDFEAADSLCTQKGPEESLGEPDDHEQSGDFDDDDIVNGKDPDIDDDGIPNDYDDNDYQWDENDSDPIDPSDPFDDSGTLPLPNGFEDDLNYYPNNLTGDSNVNSNSNGATSQDIRNLSSDQHNRVVYLNSEQSLRHNDLKNHIGDAAEFLNSEEYNRDQIAEGNANLRHNDLKNQVDSKFSGLDENQETRNVKTNSAISNVKTSVDAVGTGINTVSENINATNQNLVSLAGSLGISNGHLSDISGEIGKISNPSITLTTPTAGEIGQSVAEQLIDPAQTIDKTITDNIPDLDTTDTITAIKTKYSDRYDLFINTLGDSDLFTLPFAIFTGPSGSGSSIQTVDIGSWGASTSQTATIDFSQYDNVWGILSSVLLMLTSFSCFKILVLKKA